MAVTIQDIQQFVNTLKAISRYDFSQYSEKSLTRRLDKILVDNKMDMRKLVTKLRKDKSFLEKIVKEITVNTTELFRDPKVWHTLRYDILPEYEEMDSIKIWHPGCSTGQEVYSMLILLNEMNMFKKTKIWGSDLNIDVLESAKKGVYKYQFNIGYLDNFDKVIKENPKKTDEPYDVEYSKYLEINKAKDTIKVARFLLDKPVYAKHDLVKDDNIFSVKFDLIICRNVIIYFNHDLQNKVFSLFYDNLNDEGYLLLGMHETILGPFASKFDKIGQLYRKRPK